MGFYGDIIDNDENIEVDIPEGYTLLLTHCALDTSQPKLPQEIVLFYVKASHSDKEYILSSFSIKSGVFQCNLHHTFSKEDSPISLRAVNGTVHVTGEWKWKEDSHFEDENDEKSSQGSESCKNHITNNIKLNTNENIDEVEQKNKSKKRTIENVIEVRDEPIKEKRKEFGSVDQTTVILNSSIIDGEKEKSLKLKKWKVKPQNNEGILVIEPKKIKKLSGITITDYVIGNGAEPKLGSKVSIIYEGLFPNGVMFDSNLKRKKPFQFRKGLNQVVKGLDLGIEGMCVGGSREILIPSELGYGKEGEGDIPGNQALVFRVTLLA
eukprot:gene7547-10284_t